MKRISHLLILAAVILSFGAAQAIEFQLVIDESHKFTHPDYGQEFYKANSDMVMELKMRNNDLAGSTEYPDMLMDWCGWGMGLRMYATRGGSEVTDVTVTHVDQGGGFVTPSIVRHGGWDSKNDPHLWPQLNSLFLTSWDGNLPDTMAHHVAGGGAIPPEHPGCWLPYGIHLQLTPTVDWVSDYPYIEAQGVPGYDGDQDLLTRISFAFNVQVSGDDTISVCFDKAELDGSDFDWLFSPEQDFGGPYCFPVAAVPDLIVNPKSLSFSAMTDDALPSQQTLQLTNNSSLQYLDWSADWESSWLSVIPTSGSIGGQPVMVQVAVLTTALSPGIYRDTIDFIAPDAGNSPIRIPIEYELTEPPPTIGLSQTDFTFNAVAGAENPPDKILTIENIGYGDLNWDVSNSEDWLSLDPLSGINTGEVTLSIDITGLAYGMYYDSIVVSDPAATNSPQKAYVLLSVASDLPMIEIDSTSIFVVVDKRPPEEYPPDRQFNITNAGAGSMTYYLEESSPRITLSPSSGSVPQEINAHFKTGSPAGTEIYDTIWVYSDEAINSPQFVEFHFHFTDDPAEIIVDHSSLSVELYECGQGVGGSVPPTSLYITNSGSEIFFFKLINSSDWLIPGRTVGRQNTIVNFDFDYKELSPGIYYDTVSISAYNAVNSPVRVPVTLTILETVDTPEIYVSEDSMEFSTQVNKYGDSQLLILHNVNPGCMDWEFQNTPSWLLQEIEPDSLYPWYILLTPSGYGLSMGTYSAAIEVHSGDASNSPVDIPVVLKVWKLYGDVNWDGIVNIIDIVYLINYIYKYGPAPKPVLEVGNANCDGTINILDVVSIINYVYKGGGPLCENPYK